MNQRNAMAADVPDACRMLNDIIEIGGTTAYQKVLDVSEFTSHFLTGISCISCIVCEDSNGNILGFQALSKNIKLPSGWVDIATFARAQPKMRGVGTSLFKSTLEFVKTTDAQFINATIRADNRAGLSYYEKMGFADYHCDEAIPLNDGTLIDRISKRYELV